MEDKKNQDGQPEEAPPSEPVAASEAVPAPILEPVEPPMPEPIPSPPGPRPPSDTNTLIILGWVFIGLSLLTCCCCAWVFAPVAAILGGIAYSRGDQRGLWILIIGIVLFVLGGGFLAVGRVYHWPQTWERFPNIPGPWRRA